ncbi:MULTISPECIES: PAS domain-containing sensor histidine kinase [Halomonadaceae]|jgi:two-component system sensor kinase FixL|uniref:PAS domain-containing sensor histidine kinase n=1 Tax=Halomonadaceae TaxID=28256 RepID=UPI001E2BF835|nr:MULTISPECIES: PAS domain S-box protein [Halomonadaceae]MCD6010035.1 PAS domain S-box protein [Halomonas sp. IOP_31]
MDYRPYVDIPLPVVVVVVAIAGKHKGQVSFANPQAERLSAELGLTTEDLLPSGAFKPLSTARLSHGLEWIRGMHALRWRPTPLDPRHCLWIAEVLSEEHAIIVRLTKDRDRYRELAESTTDLISRHAKDGTFLYASRAAKTLLGYEPEELIGASAYDMFHPDDLTAMLNKSPRIYHDSGFYQQTYRFRAKDGHYVWFETTSRTHRDPLTGELIDILCVSRDVSRRIHAEATRERLARVVESTTDYVLFVDDSEKVFYSNEAARYLLQLSSQESEIQLNQAYQEESLRRLRQTAFTAASRQGAWSGELEMRSPRGPVPVLTVVISHRGPGPGSAQDHLSLLNRDIGLRKKAEDQARIHQQQIAHANRLAATGELASNIAHELNQPLGAIANYASGVLMQLRARPGLPALALEEPLSRLNDQVQRLAERLRHIRNFVRKGQIRPGPVALEEVLDSACHLCEWQFRAKRIEIDIVSSPGLPPVMADATALEQVVVNLLLNALDASCDTPDARHVRLESWQSGPGELAFSVTDQGPGLTPEAAAAAFTTFYSTKPEGLGMGLAISRSLIETMGGKLFIDDSYQAGARFVVALPKASTSCRDGINGTLGGS